MNFYEEMSQEFLNSNDFLDLYKKLLKLQTFSSSNKQILNFKEIKYLLKVASIFSFSDNEKTKKKAYKIAAILSERYSDEYEMINKAAQYIFITSGLLPAVKKNLKDGNEDFFSMYSLNREGYNIYKFKDVLKKQLSNHSNLVHSGGEIYFTDFQEQVINSLDEGISVSISAPTSAGKSFLLLHFLAKRIKENESITIVYIVPSRALISQVQRDFYRELASFGLNDILITSSGNYVNESEKIKIYILTQERLHNLLFDSEFNGQIDILIIDEAHKVSDLSRGILLEEVIEEAIARFPDIQKIFLSPFAKNPNKFAKMFNLEHLKPIKTHISPVSQNLLKLEITDDKYLLKLDSDDFSNEDILIEGGEVEIQIDKRKCKKWRLLWAAYKFASEANIIYCNSPDTCKSYANLFSSFYQETSSEKIVTAINFLKEEIHEKYFLIECLKKGIGYHYGNMPVQVRSLVENLFRNKEIKFLFCTSTLLEGVNLPASNIFIESPKQGKPMNKINFWNLAGRAGRLLQDYYGNIYCINPERWEDYKPDSSDIEQDIDSALEGTFTNKHKEILEYLKSLYKELKIERSPEAAIEQAITRFIIHEMKYGDRNFVNNILSRVDNPNKLTDGDLDIIRKEIMKIKLSIKLPPELIQKNSSINPIKQQKLFDEFSRNSYTLPLHPKNKNFTVNLEKIVEQIVAIFMEEKIDSKRYVKLTHKWIQGNSVKKLISHKIWGLKQYKTEVTDKMINNSIDRLLKDINQKVRFQLKLYLKCYVDLLIHFFEESKFENKKICVNLPKYIEYGSFDQNVILLQTMGLSRSTSINIVALLPEDFNDEKDAIKWIRKNRVILEKELSPISYKELAEII